MASYLRNILKNLSTRILVIIFLALLSSTIFYLLFSYYTQLAIYEQSALKNLNSVARTLAIQIDGNKHQELMMKYPVQDDISSNDQDPIYLEIHNMLALAQLNNELNTDIYTMIYDEKSNDSCFYFGVTSGETTYYRHCWRKFHQIHVDNYLKGGEVPKYTDEHGVWLSAFAPLMTKSGRVVGIVQVDQEFTEFINKVKNAMYKQTLIVFIAFMIIGLFLFVSIRKILLFEQQMLAEVTEKNKEIIASIAYAKNIQNAVLPSENVFQQYLPDSFIFYRPKDIVSGDFYWISPVNADIYEKNKTIAFSAVDCTGHGVPGAFMSLIGNNYLNKAMLDNEIIRPAEALNTINRELHDGFIKNSDSDIIRDGMDIAFCTLDMAKYKLYFAGAKSPLYIIRDGELIEIKGDRHPIGSYVGVELKRFKEHVVNLHPGDCIYIFSDGYPDQFGGPKGKKMYYSRYKDLLIKNSAKPMQEQKRLIGKFLDEWKGDLEQVDDITIIGVRVK